MKSLFKNSVYNILYRCLNVIFPLITVSYVSRVLQASGVGEVASATNIANYFTVLAALGLPTYGTKVIAACRNKNELNKSFWELFSINMISTLLFATSYYSMILIHPFFEKDVTLYCVVGLAIVFNFINVDWFYQGKEEFAYITIRSFVIKSLSMIAIFVFVRTKEDMLEYAIILTLSNVSNYIFNIIHIRKFISFSVPHLEIVQHLRPIFLLLFASIVIELYTMVGTTMLTVFSNSESVGYYVNSMSVIRIVRTLVTAVCAVFLPRLSYYYYSGNNEAFEKLIVKGLGILIYLTVPAAIGVFMVSTDTVLVLFGNSFVQASISVKILSLSIITIALSNFIGYQIFITIKKERLMVFSTIVGAVTNISLNMLLVGKLDYVGVAIASSVSELAVTVFQIYKLKKLNLLHVDKNLLKSVLISSIIMIIIICLIYQIGLNPLTELLTIIVIGAGSYLFLTLIQKNEYSKMFMQKIQIIRQKK